MHDFLKPRSVDIMLKLSGLPQPKKFASHLSVLIFNLLDLNYSDTDTMSYSMKVSILSDFIHGCIIGKNHQLT